MPEQGIVLTSLTGGMNDTLPPSALPDDQCVLAENAEFFASKLGERRNGCGPLSITSSGLTGQAAIVHLSEWFPSNSILAAEWWAIGSTVGVSTAVARRSTGTWAPVVPSDAILTSAPDVYSIGAQTLGPKHFFSYSSAVDRMHVWDQTTLRRAGLAQPAAAPTGANEGAGAYASIRYFRVRYTKQSGTTIQVRSEPSVALTFTPSGAGAGTTITRPALLGESETHWEVEASKDNATFYRIATVAIATTTYNDETAYATGYAAAGTLSEDIGTYLLLPSARFLAVDGDRLLLGGHWTDTSKQSTISWTPVSNDPGVGNDERLPLAVDNTVPLDNNEGGPLTGISSAIDGTWYAFKWSHIYRMVRTGDVTRAYTVLTLTKAFGAVPGSIFKGLDGNGAPCIYFTDPMVGPARISSEGVQIMTGLRTTWARVNLTASIVARGVYYPLKQQAHWWLAVDGADVPTLKIVSQVSEVRPSGDGMLSGGWSTATGRIAQAYTVALFTESISVNGIVTLSARPFIGLTSADFIQRCDTGTTDAGTAFVATIRTRPYIVAGLLNRWGAMTGALLATANASLSVVVKFIRDFGLETTQVTTPLAATGSETHVIKRLTSLSMSGATAIQIEFTDA